MPRFDGTGPRGQGPMTGRGEGYCAVKLPAPGQASYGYAGQRGIPVRLTAPPAWLGHMSGRGRGAGRGRGRRLNMRRW